MISTPKTAISVVDVSKSFRLPHEKNTSIKHVIINVFRSKRKFEKQQVLNDISFEVKEGEFFGVVGRNGSGKSTMLKLLAGIYSPDTGAIKLNGSLTPFIELGVGFNQELTGRENVFLNGALLGFNREEMARMYDDIVKFAGLERFMDQKLKNYSSGMQVRLAFSIAIKVDSDILLLDEVLAVGDTAFQKKCFAYFRRLKKEKKTVVFISHDMTAVREYCDKAILIEKGQIVASGSADEVAKQYTQMFMEPAKKQDNKDTEIKDGKRWGTGKVRAQLSSLVVADQEIEIKVNYKMKEDVRNPIFGLSIYSPVGIKVFEANTKWKKVKTGQFKKGETAEVAWRIPNIFTNGTNYVSFAVANSDATEFYDWWDEAASFIIDKDSITTAVTMPEYNLEIANARRS